MKSLEEQLKEGLTKLQEQTKGLLPVEFGVELKMSPGGLTGTQFRAVIGGILDDSRIYEWGDSAEQVVCKAIEKIAGQDIVQKIRMERFNKLAAELGLEVTVKPKARK